MAVSSNIQINSKTTTPVNATSSLGWGLRIDLTHSAGSDTTDLADVEICIGIMHYWRPSTDTGLTVDTNYTGNVYGTYSGTKGNMQIEIVPHVDSIDKPVIYPLGQNARCNAVIKISFPDSTLQFTGTNSGITDISIYARDYNYKPTKYYSSSDPRDVEDSYSYRDNAGAAEDSYASNSKIWVVDTSDSDTVKWGNEPDWDGQNIVVISCNNFSTISENTPDTSDESGTSAQFGCGSYVQNAIFTGVNPAPPNFNTVLHAEAWFHEAGVSYITGTPQIDLMPLSSLPDSTPTWNEVASNRGSAVATLTPSAGYLNTNWKFESSSFNTLIASWLTNWSSNHKGLALGYNVEAQSNSTHTFRSDDYSVDEARPVIFVAYTTTTEQTTRRIFLVT